MSKAICYDNWYNEPNYLTKGITEISHKTYWKKIYSQKEFLTLERMNYLKSLMNDVVKIAFPYNIKGILKDVVKIEFNSEYQEYIPIIEEFSEENLIFMLNYKTQYLFDVINTYDKYVDNHINKHNILNEVFKLTHSINTRLSKEKMNAWIENFPNFIDAKIKAIKNKQKDALRQKQARLRYKTSQLRFLNIIKQINNLGYYGFNESQIKPKMKYMENDEIIQELIQEITDQYGSDHDTIEYNENQQDPNEKYYLEKEKEQFIDYLIKNNIKWKISWN